MRSINPRLKKRKSRSIKLKTGYKMAKRRKAKRSVKRSSKVLGINTAAIMGPLLYGAVRARTSALIAPYTVKIPLGNIGDEVGMYALASLGKKFVFKKAGIVRDALSAGQVIELARIGDAIASGELGLFNSAAAPTNSNIF